MKNIFASSFINVKCSFISFSLSINSFFIISNFIIFIHEFFVISTINNRSTVYKFKSIARIITFFKYIFINIISIKNFLINNITERSKYRMIYIKSSTIIGVLKKTIHVNNRSFKHKLVTGIRRNAKEKISKTNFMVFTIKRNRFFFSGNKLKEIRHKIISFSHSLINIRRIISSVVSSIKETNSH